MFWIHLSFIQNIIFQCFFHRNNFHRTSFGFHFTTFGYGVVGRFQSVKTFGIYTFVQHRFTVFLGHLKLNGCHFHIIIAPNVFVPDFNIVGIDLYILHGVISLSQPLFLWHDRFLHKPMLRWFFQKEKLYPQLVL